MNPQRRTASIMHQRRRLKGKSCTLKQRPLVLVPSRAGHGSLPFRLLVNVSNGSLLRSLRLDGRVPRRNAALRTVEARGEPARLRRGAGDEVEEADLLFSHP